MNPRKGIKTQVRDANGVVVGCKGRKAMNPRKGIKTLLEKLSPDFALSINCRKAMNPRKGIKTRLHLLPGVVVNRVRKAGRQ